MRLYKFSFWLVSTALTSSVVYAGSSEACGVFMPEMPGFKRVVKIAPPFRIVISK